MNAHLSSLTATRPLEARLEAIIERAIGELEDGAPIDVEALAAAHPEFAAQLRELLPMVAALVSIGGGGADPADFAAGANGHAPAPPYRQLGDFRLIREIGRGGMGTVYEAEQLTMGRRVALKVLPFAALAHEKSLQRFRNEVRAAAALDHPHIVSVYSVGEERGIHYFAMQLIRGQTLAELIAAQKASRGVPAPGAPGNENPTIDSSTEPPSTVAVEQARLSTVVDSRRKAEHYRTAARLGIQAAEALQHAHDQGVLHRDVKPGNLMLDGEGKLSITDFGLARIEADAGMTMTGDIVGTLRYMAPEQALAKRVLIDQRADIYSLGATLYEALTLEPAFGTADRGELIKQLAFSDPRRLRHIDPQIPRGLETITLKSMAKSPDDRYQRAGDLADDVSAFLDDRPIVARPESTADKGMRWARRHRGIAIAIGLAATLLLMVVSAVLADSARRVRESREYIGAQSAAAIAELAANHPDAASVRVAEALSRVASDGLRDSPLAERCVEIQNEIQRYSAFLDECEIARRTRSGDLTLNLRCVDAALERYGIRSNHHWLAVLQGNRWPDAHIARITESAYEMLLLRADCLTRWVYLDPIVASSAEARACIGEALRFHLPSRGSHWLLGNCAHIDGDKSRASDLHDLALECEPQSAAELFYICRDRRWGTHSEQAGYPTYSVEQCLADLRAMLRFDSNYYNAFFFMALKLDEEHRDAEALLGWYACLARFPDDLTALLNRAGTLWSLGRHDEAITDATAVSNKVERGSRSWAAALEIRGRCYFKQGRFEDALVDFDLVANEGLLDTEGTALYTSRALTHRVLGHHAQSLADLEKAVTIPKPPLRPAKYSQQALSEAYAQLAQQLAASPVDNLRDGKRALELAQRAYDIAGDVQPLYTMALAVAYAEIGDFNAAVTWTERALAIQDSNVSDKELNEQLHAFRRGEPWRFDAH